ncbi:PP2C family protein-serine/threonine phosphatase, partial [Streptomyces sp. NPDC047022]|uniref:PP2C family protein-serine/threonine phosphatase n=1 Tax=Streptomyces sp. NPDC047022 TaxID=3155737 RepID=UPI0033E90AA2
MSVRPTEGPPARKRNRRVPLLRCEAWVLIPLGIIAVVLALNAPSPVRGVPSGIFLILAPLIAELFGGPRHTAVVGVLTVGAQIYLAMTLSISTGQYAEGAIQVAVFTALCVFLVIISKARHRRQCQLDQVRNVSEAAQRALMRPLPRSLGQLHLASFYLAATAEAEIGGDLYTAARTTHGTRMIIGDVRGKGLDAVGESALLMGAFREAADRHADLTDLANTLDRSVTRYLADFIDDNSHVAERFITALLLNIPDDEPLVQIVNCGHPPPLLIRDGSVQALANRDPAPPLGM